MAKKLGTPLQKVRTIYSVTEYRLENGLRVLYRRDTTSPAVAVCVTYHVGSRNEASGHTGATHILEHLMFKDSKKFNRANGKAVTDLLESLGANMNATTSLDRTNYFEVLPREHVEQALAMEADRMRNSQFNDADLASEMTVVRNEYERGRNDPYELLLEDVLATAFTTHPYRIPTIGSKEDIEHSTAATLRRFYDTFYWPNNATLAVIGDIDRATLEALVVKYYARIPRAPHAIPTMDIREPEQEKPYATSFKHPAGVSIVAVAYKTPEATHIDYPAIMYLMTILAGSFAARLQRLLVDTGRVAHIQPILLPTIDPSITTLIVTLSDGTTPEFVRNTIRSTIADISEKGITKAEFTSTRTRLLSQTSAEHDGCMNEVASVSEAVAAGDWTLSYRMKELVNTVTQADIKRVARTYFTEKRETYGILVNTL